MEYEHDERQGKVESQGRGGDNGGKGREDGVTDLVVNNVMG